MAHLQPSGLGLGPSILVQQATTPPCLELLPASLAILDLTVLQPGALLPQVPVRRVTTAQAPAPPLSL